MNYLENAFKQLNMLNEDTFDVDKKGLEDLEAVIDTKEDDVVDIIDINAESENDLKKSYLGKVVIDCCTCHSKIYKDPGEIKIIEDTDVVNTDEECPYCFCTDGFTIVGQIKEFDPTKGVEKETEVETEESLTEDFKDVTITTDDTRMEMTSDENGKVTVTTEPIESKEHCEECEDDEVIGHVDFATKDKIKEINDIDGSEEETEEEIDDYDEESIDELGESYFKRVYDNVDSYRTTSISQDKNHKTIVEGVIKFKSGNSKKTSFLFETIAKHNGKFLLVGENLQLSKGKKSFQINGSVNNKKFIAESFRYNYVANSNKSKGVRIYGTVKR